MCCHRPELPKARGALRNKGTTPCSRLNFRMKDIEAMKASERGSKHVCTECATGYYDLNKKAIACPRCGARPETPKPRDITARAGRGKRGIVFGRYPK